MPKFLRLNILTTASQPWKAYEAQQKIKNDTKQQSIKEYGTDKAMRSRQLELNVQLIIYSMAEHNIPSNILKSPRFRE
jgi:hypothetical protein